MKKLWNRIWNAEPVVFTGAIATTWTAVVTFDKANTELNINIWVYIIMIVVTVFLTAITRNQVTPPRNQ